MTIELAPELEAQVERVAAARGIAPGEYVGELVAVSLAWRKAPKQDRENIREFLDRWASIARPVDALTTETFSREMLYADDDKFTV